ncbi:hypothetical protein NDU88_006146 [Pleurodeles waltl]|uniref:Uncharacterized protein n=1 Tax=Pleurodeles waltl TaxID=8319 RepID=A0AAV7RPG1_PLEWA|nr:hypothetical protein NDU88_006146 [Pleurodeles waltl]
MVPQPEQKATTRGPPSPPRAQSPVPPSPGVAKGARSPPRPWGVTEVRVDPWAHTQRQLQALQGDHSVRGETCSSVTETSQSLDSGDPLHRPTDSEPLSSVPRFSSGVAPVGEASFVRIFKVGRSKPSHSPAEGRLYQGDLSTRRASPLVPAASGHRLSAPGLKEDRQICSTGRAERSARGPHQGSAPLRPVRTSAGRPVINPSRSPGLRREPRGTGWPPRGVFLRRPRDSPTPRPLFGRQLGVSPAGGPLQGDPRGYGGRRARRTARPATPLHRCA